MMKKLYEKSEVLRQVPLILGEISEAEMEQFDVVVLSPGVPTDLPMVNMMRDKGIAIWVEKIRAAGDSRRMDMSDIIKESGFDINSTVVPFEIPFKSATRPG